ncbi:MAG: trypsin-like peptidase domain-containing protein [Armatimonadetes bacterium]|nr:trypsin-like peptidase domain-containing protein [Anaerolineae bacterium]
MKRFALILVLISTLLGGISAVAAQDETLSSADLNRISTYIVYILALEDGEPFASGSGTIMNATGTIFTNQHVVEGGDDYAIYLLEDMAELPVLSYYASVTFASNDIDFAVLQIDRDERGRELDPQDLDLPFIENVSSTVNYGEPIYIFGFPDIGDGYLVLTQGSITTIENGDINRERLPVWYRTDAEMSSGNSGGLVVNGRGEYIGIPTWVRKADTTLGQLGGILPVPAISAIIGSDFGDLTPDQVPDNNDREQDVVSVTLVNDARVDICGLYFSPTTSSDWGTNFLDNSTLDQGDNFEFEVQPGDYDIRLDDCDDEPLDDARDIAVTANTEIVYDRDGIVADSAPSEEQSDPTLEVIVQDIEYDVEIEGEDEAGIKVYAYIRATGYEGVDLRAALFYYDTDGEPLSGENANDESQTPSGNLTVQTVITPEYGDTEWDGFWFWMPYSAFPDFRGDELEGFVQLEIGEDAGVFSAFSNEVEFVIEK